MSAAAEEGLLAEIERRLLDEFPGVTPADVAAVVRQAHARFDSSRVRDFIPLFVEKHARRELAQRGVGCSV